MTATTFYLDTTDSHRIAVHHWPTSAPLRGVLHWLHGMAEHGLRYEEFAEALNAAGWALYVHDHRGHGQSTDSGAPLGHLADEEGWQKLQNDISVVQQWLRREHVEIPLVLGGHSMGSFAALNWAQDYAEVLPLAGLILCGSDYRSPRLHALAAIPIRLENWRVGKRNSSALIQSLTFKAWGKKFPDDDSEFAWLNSDKAEVEKYESDPLCGFDCSTGLWLDLILALKQIHRKRRLAALPRHLPVLIIGGEDDPMSDFGQRLTSLAKVLKQTGSQSVTLALYPQARHEVLKDKNGRQAQQELLQWLTQRNTQA